MPGTEPSREIREIFERCRHRYPAIDLAFELFCARISRILAAAHAEHGAAVSARTEDPDFCLCPDCLSMLAKLHHEDLFVATACAHGGRIAWEHFADEYLPLLRRFAEHACRDRDSGEDLAQEIVASLLGECGPLADEGGPAPQEEKVDPPVDDPVIRGKIGSYDGRASLAGWLRVAASHAAIDRFRRARHQVSLEELQDPGELAAPRDPDPEKTAERKLDARWGPIFAEVLGEELSKLSGHERLLLSLYYLEGVSLKAIGIRYGVHEATASRWLEHLRRDVRKQVERRLRKEHRFTKGDIRSMWDLMSEMEDRELKAIMRSLSRK